MTCPAPLQIRRGTPDVKEEKKEASPLDGSSLDRKWPGRYTEYRRCI